MKRMMIFVSFLLCGMVADAQDWAKFDRYSEANKEVSVSPKVVFMGDSITDFWVDNDPDFFTENNYVGRGISGQTTSHMLVRFRRDVIDLSPKYVVILAGTNDIARNNGEISLENVVGNIASMCELARANGIRPVICSVLPATSFYWRPEVKPAQDIVLLNEMLREYADSERIRFVDYHSALKDENDGLPLKYAKDGVHPDLACYKIMEEMILELKLR